MRKTIQFIYSGEIFRLPPFLTILDCLKEDFHLKVLCYETKSNFDRLIEVFHNDNIDFENAAERKLLSASLIARAKRKIRRILKIETIFHKRVKEVLEHREYDKLWIIHENTLYKIMDLLRGKKYTVSMYELNDARGDFLNIIKKGLQEAEELVVCEPNRAQILRTWMNLSSTPLVIPNKPLKHPRSRNIPLENDYGFDGKKIILYQGHIQKNRNVDAFCKAVSDMDDFTLVLMGAKTIYRDILRETYPKVRIIDFVNPPEHLYITSHAYIGIVKYDYVDLNSIYCAPNKTYEYAGFGIPMIANTIPGLVNSVGRFGAAECIDTDNVEDIKQAILKIDAAYSSYEKGALDFYNSIDIKTALLKIASE